MLHRAFDNEDRFKHDGGIYWKIVKHRKIFRVREDSDIHKIRRGALLRGVWQHAFAAGGCSSPVQAEQAEPSDGAEHLQGIHANPFLGLFSWVNIDPH
jgi:hypothetical protein